MSRRPDAQGIAKLRMLLDRRVTIKRDLAIIEEAIIKANALQVELEYTANEIMKLTKDMDCQDSGNFGWQMRFLSLLEGIATEPRGSEEYARDAIARLRTVGDLGLNPQTSGNSEGI